MTHPSFAGVGGAEILAARHATFLRDAGHQVRLATSALNKEEWSHLLQGVDVRVVPWKQWSDGIGIPGRFPKLRRRAIRMAAALEGAPVVLAENYPANIVAAGVRSAQRTVWYCNEPSRRLYAADTFPNLAARARCDDPRASAALIGWARDYLARHDAALLEQGTRLSIDRALDTTSVARLTRIVANSQYIAGVVQRIYGRTPDAVIYPTVLGMDDTVVRRPAGVDERGLRVLTHSRLESFKNIEMVLRGFHAFAERAPGAHELHIVGEGSEERSLRELAQRLQLGARVYFHGFLDQPALETVYARCEVMAVLPADEPFGMVFPEAAARGLLLIGPDHGGPAEILEGGELGWTLDIFSPEPLADALAEAWHLPAHEVTRRRERAAKACRDRYGPRATLPALLAQLVE